MIKAMTQEGFIFISSSGNNGPEYQTINYPGDLYEVITIGSMDPMRQQVSDFSSRGPVRGESINLVDIVKPAVLTIGEGIFRDSSLA